MPKNALWAVLASAWMMGCAPKLTVAPSPEPSKNQADVSAPKGAKSDPAPPVATFKKEPLLYQSLDPFFVGTSPYLPTHPLMTAMTSELPDMAVSQAEDDMHYFKINRYLAEACDVKPEKLKGFDHLLRSTFDIAYLFVLPALAAVEYLDANGKKKK